MYRLRALASILLVAPAAAQTPSFSMPEVLDYPYVSGLRTAARADVIAWVANLEGVRNVWVARAPSYAAVQVTSYSQDDGQEITQLTFSPDGMRLYYVRGGDHDANWPAEGKLSPDPASSPERPVTAIWAIGLDPAAAIQAPLKIADGDAPAVSASGRLAFVRDDQVFTAPPDGGKAERLFFDRGKDADLRWSPDGSRLAFVSNRGDHAFIGVFTSGSVPILYLAPSTGNDGSPRWSPDGKRIAFARQPGEGGAPEPLLTRVPHPWSIWVASADDGSGHAAWVSPDTLAGSYPDVEGEANLHWAAGDRLVFLAYLDEWPHLYSVPAGGGAPLLLTPGAFMVEHVAASRDLRYMIYDANTGTAAGDDDRRHIFRVAVDRPGSLALTAGESVEWTPVSAGAGHVAFVAADAHHPPVIDVADLAGKHRAALDAPALPADFPLTQLLTPKRVTFEAPDGTLVHGQLFDHPGSARRRPAVIFVHGGPPRQMLLGWHYMGYYSNAYAVNQYLAAHGFIVLSVNYRLGIGYGRSFQQPDHAGFAGAAEYQDVLAGARFLQALPGVDADRIGIWGGSYGGYLTALALARDSEVFKAGVDLHGVHDWSLDLRAWIKPPARYEKGDFEQTMRVAWESSPDSAIEGWRSPVLLIQGDDDRNVQFQQTIDLARRLQAHHLPFEELVIPNEIHGFLRHASWLRVDEAAASFLTRTLEER
ncbi:MAG TPA: prolyl oligopeptidase family serine peptidase [Steroidobacteraceae bacterium]|nr:prolyl oligopeptidase family serine peptidase [Steroidobacteraceae bacterium]